MIHFCGFDGLNGCGFGVQVYMILTPTSYGKNLSGLPTTSVANLFVVLRIPNPLPEIEKCR